MLGTLLSSLNSLRDFLSRAFLIAAFIPALLFVFLNALMLYLLSWGAHDWLINQLLADKAPHRIVLFTALFLGVWISAYVVAALTPIWTRTLEGRNWWIPLRTTGIAYQRARFQELAEAITATGTIAIRVEKNRAGWKTRLEQAAQAPNAANPRADAAAAVGKLRTARTLYAPIPFDDVEDAYAKLTVEAARTGVTDELKSLAAEMPLLIQYAINRAEREHSRLLAERNMNFGSDEDIAPTAFGNVGLVAEAYARRAYHCNLPQIWGALRQATQKDDKLGPALEDAKMQLDFLVACYLLFLTWSLLWAGWFAWKGLGGWAALFAFAGPSIACLLWYGAAVERYRVMQDLITSLLDSMRFTVLGNLHLPPPGDLEEERAMWSAIDGTIGNGESGNLRYRQGAAS